MLGRELARSFARRHGSDPAPEQVIATSNSNLSPLPLLPLLLPLLLFVFFLLFDLLLIGLVFSPLTSLHFTISSCKLAVQFSGRSVNSRTMKVPAKSFSSPTVLLQTS